MELLTTSTRIMASTWLTGWSILHGAWIVAWKKTAGFVCRENAECIEFNGDLEGNSVSEWLGKRTCFKFEVKFPG